MHGCSGLVGLCGLLADGDWGGRGPDGMDKSRVIISHCIVDLLKRAISWHALARSQCPRSESLQPQVYIWEL